MADKIISHIAPGATFEQEGPVKVTGDIGEGARVIVTGGGLTVEGSVGNHAYIETKTKEEAGGNRVSGIFGRNIVITGSSMVNIRVNGQDITGGSMNSGGPLIIKGRIGDDVTLRGCNDVEIGDAGDRLDVKSMNGCDFGRVGHDAIIKAGNSLDGISTGERAQLKAGNGANLETLGAGSELKAGNGIRLGLAARDCHVKAGNGLKVTQADRSARLKAGNSLKVGSYLPGAPEGPQ